jgi:thioesterase domain-containing protein
MSPDELQAYVHAKIPLAAFMQVSVASLAPDTLELAAPLEPNLNVHGTLFGGSGAALGLLAAWALAFLRVRDDELVADLVVRSHHMSYLKPITGSVVAAARFKEADTWQNFAASVRHTGRGRLAVEVALESDGHVCARLTAEFAVRRGQIG